MTRYRPQSSSGPSARGRGDGEQRSAVARSRCRVVSTSREARGPISGEQSGLGGEVPRGA